MPHLETGSPVGGAFLDAFIPDEAAKEMQRLHNGGIPAEPTARDTIRLGHNLGFTVRETGQRKYGFPVFDWLDENGGVVYSGPAQQEFSQLALLFAIARQEHFRRMDEAAKRDFDFTMPFNVTTLLQGEKTVEQRNEHSELENNSEDYSTAPEIESQDASNLSVAELVDHYFGKPKTELSTEVFVPSKTQDVEMPEQLTEPQGRHAAPKERFDGFRRRIVGGALATVALVGGLFLTSDGTPKQNAKPGIAISEKPKENLVHLDLRTVSESKSETSAGSYTVIKAPDNEVMYVTGKLHNGHNPWEMSQDALGIAGMKGNSETIAQADPYSASARQQRLAKKLGAGSILRWRVTHDTRGRHLQPVES